MCECVCVGGCRLLLVGKGVGVFVYVGVSRWVIEHSLVLMDVCVGVCVSGWTRRRVYVGGIQWVF